MEGLAGDPELCVKAENVAARLRKVVDKIKEDSSKILSMFMVGLTVLQPYHAAIAGSRFAIRRFGVPEELSSIYVSKFHTSMHTLNMFGVIIVNLYMWFYGSRNLRFNPLLSVFTNFLVAASHIALLISYLVKSPKDLTTYYWFSSASAFMYGMNQAFVASVGVEYLSFFVSGLQFAGIGVTLFHSLFMSASRLFPKMDTDYWIVTIQITLFTIVSISSLLLWNSSFGQGDLSRMLKGEAIQGDKRDEIQILNSMTGAGLYVTRGEDLTSTSGPKAGRSSSFRTNGSEPYGTPLALSSARMESPGRRSPRLSRNNSSEVTNPESTLDGFNGRNQANSEPHGYQSNLGMFDHRGNTVGFNRDHSDESVEVAKEGDRYKYTAQPRDPNIFLSLKLSTSPILMSAFSMSLAFFFYPSVSPYKLAELKDAHKIDLSVLVVAAVPTIAVCAMCLMDCGPNRRWVNEDKYWHYCWYLAVPYLFSCVSFVVAMHYPGTKYAKFVKNPAALSFLVDLMIACYSLLKTVGYAGAGMQEERRNGTVSTFNVMFSFLFLFTGVFWGSGYIKLYNKHKPEDWPTRDMSLLKAFMYWSKCSFHLGFANFTKIVTKDLMEDIKIVKSP